MSAASGFRSPGPCLWSAHNPLDEWCGVLSGTAKLRIEVNAWRRYLLPPERQLHSNAFVVQRGAGNPGATAVGSVESVPKNGARN